MPFDFGFNFRSTSGYVTDAAYAAPVLNEVYPHTYTNGNSLTINAGMVTSGTKFKADRDNTLDPRIAGVNFVDAAINPWTFQVDLSSGSAPGAGTYTIDLAAGDPAGTRTMTITVKDNTSIVVDLTNGGSGYVRATNHFLDASGGDITGSATWGGTQRTGVVFSSTTVNLVMNEAGADFYHTVAHFRLIQTSGGGPVAIPRVLMPTIRPT